MDIFLIFHRFDTGDNLQEMPKLTFWEKNKKNILECHLLNFLPRVLECMVKKMTWEKICDLSLFCTIKNTFDHSLIIDL